MEESYTLYKRVTEQYKDEQILKTIGQLLPNEILDLEKPVDSLLEWYKNDFMAWVPKEIKCGRCCTTGSYPKSSMETQVYPGTSWRLRKTEVYSCPNCHFERRFPRYGEVLKIADSREGRCSEWSILFGAMLSSLSMKARIVHDYLDHCWNEVMLNGRWTHVDSTLQFPFSLDNPKYYELNWGKKYLYILAFTSDSVEDVTRVYSYEWEKVLQRRKHAQNVHVKNIEGLNKIYQVI